MLNLYYMIDLFQEYPRLSILLIHPNILPTIRTEAPSS